MKKYKLSDLFDLQMGKTPARNNPKYWEEGTNPWISIADMSSNGKYITTTKECITDRAISDTGIRPIFPGTVIMSFKLSIGKVARTTVKSYSNEAIMAFEIKDREPSQYTIDNDYAYYLLSALNFENIGNKAVMGKTLNKAILENTEVYVHPWDEQRRIISKLDKVIELIKLRTQQLSKLDELVKSRFVELFGLPVSNSKNWKTEKMNDIAPAVNYSGDFEETVWLLNLDMVEAQTGRIIDYLYVAEEEVGNSTCTFDTSNVLYSKLRPYLNKVVIPDRCGYATSEMIPLKPNPMKLERTYLAFMLRSDEFVNMINEKVAGAKMPRVSMGDFRGFDVPVPPIELQKQFTALVEQTDKSKFEIQKSLEKLETLKKALMQKYFG